VAEPLLTILPLAVGVLITPTAMIAVILLLMTPRAKANAAALIAGWTISLVLVVVVAYEGSTAAGSGAVSRHEVGAIVMLVLGGLLIIAGGLVLRRAHAKQGRSKLPRWLQAVDSFTPRRSFLVGLAVADVKNLVLAAAAVSALAASSSQTAEFVPLLVFVLVGSLGVLMPVGVHVFGGDRSALTLQHWRAWLVGHNSLIMAIVLFVCGALLIARGVVAQ
jgi:Sap, sulfolipid-1-addressing protein